MSKDRPPSIKSLFLAANPSHTTKLRLGEELRELQKRLQPESFWLEERPTVRPEDIAQAILEVKPHIIHFSGGGSTAGVLYSEDASGQIQPIQPEALSALFELVNHSVKCIILNASYLDIQAQAIAQHIPCVISMSGQLEDRAAIAFSVIFYKALGADHCIEQAYRFGCAAIRLQGYEEQPIPVLYKSGRPITDERLRDRRHQTKLWVTEKKPTEVPQDFKTASEPASKPIQILHLSDLHLSADVDPESLLEPLIFDLQDPYEGLGLEQLDYAVISGDLTNRATPEEFEQARQFVAKLLEAFELGSDSCIVVPGNHDLSWEEKVYEWQSKRQVNEQQLKRGRYLEQEKVFLIQQEDTYPQRFAHFSRHFYRPLFQRDYPLSYKQQAMPLLFPETRLQFLALNSCWEIDEFFPDRSSIHPGALTQGLKAANDQIKYSQAKLPGEPGSLSPDAKLLRIAIWHHPIAGNEKIEQDAFLERLQREDFKLCLHGHVHEERADLIGYHHPTRHLYVAGTGSFGAPTHARPEFTPRLYNVLAVERDHRRIRVHTRCLRKDGGAWAGWHHWPKAGQTAREAYYDIHLA